MILRTLEPYAHPRGLLPHRKGRLVNECPCMAKEVPGVRLRTASTKPAGGIRILLFGILATFLVACGGARGEGEDMAQQGQEPVALGPRDGQELPRTDLGRVAVGTIAPDFALETLAGDTLILSSFRGTKNVLLVFYRGHW